MLTHHEDHDHALRPASQAGAARGIGVGALIAGTLDDAMNRRETQEPPPFGLVTVRGARARPGVDLDRTRGLDAQGDEARFGRRML